jgi:hypothetical protein
MDQIKFVAARGQQPAGPEAERPRFRKTSRTHHRELEGVDPRMEFTGVGNPKRVGIAIQVQTGHRCEPDAFIDFGPGLAGEYLDRMAKGHQLPGEMAGIDALTATPGIPPVDEKGDPKTTRARRAGRYPLRNRGWPFRALCLGSATTETRHGIPLHMSA